MSSKKEKEIKNMNKRRLDDTMKELVEIGLIELKTKKNLALNVYIIAKFKFGFTNIKITKIEKYINGLTEDYIKIVKKNPCERDDKYFNDVGYYLNNYYLKELFK